MSFPERSFWGTPIGWKDNGETGSWSEKDTPLGMEKTKRHSFCMNRLHVGVEDGKMFLFCPVCVVKTPA